MITELSAEREEILLIDLIVRESEYTKKSFRLVGMLYYTNVKCNIIY